MDLRMVETVSGHDSVFESRNDGAQRRVDDFASEIIRVAFRLYGPGINLVGRWREDELALGSRDNGYERHVGVIPYLPLQKVKFGAWLGRLRSRWSSVHVDENVACRKPYSLWNRGHLKLNHLRESRVQFIAFGEDAVNALRILSALICEEFSVHEFLIRVGNNEIIASTNLATILLRIQFQVSGCTGNVADKATSNARNAHVNDLLTVESPYS